MKKLLSLTLLTFFLTACSNATDIKQENDTVSSNPIPINLSEISDEYLSEEIETHYDVSKEYKDTKNTIVTLSKPGTYEFSGSIKNAQIRIDTETSGDFNIIHNGVNIPITLHLLSYLKTQMGL